ncbi:MAG: hypothetical protein EP343_06135 [Deltaproteobacteria bacterium]|nr:MAG: hypothetical protein EP343_06135 [Deltaproteobacteria bacterium]
MEPVPHVLADAALEGTVLTERYLVESKLGKGGMAWVYHGARLPERNPVALKILFSQLSADENFRSRFLREAQIQFQLEHKNITRVYESFEDRGIVGFAMEWCNSGDMLHYLRQHKQQFGQPMTWEQMQPLILPLLSALNYAHQRGVVHRDLKPQNILLHQNDEGVLFPKLTDFGIAKLLDAASVTKTGSMVGTLHYMSPEQVSESKNVDWRTDIYSVGVLLYLLSTLRMPFTGQSTGLMLKIVQDEPEPPFEAPGPLQEVILRCLAKDPNDRYYDCASIKADLIERLGRIPDDLSMSLDGSILAEHLSSVRPLAGEEFVSEDKANSLVKEAPSSDDWVPPPQRDSFPTIRMENQEEALPRRSLPWGFWVLAFLSMAAFAGFIALQWNNNTPAPPPRTKVLAKARVTPRPRKRVPRPLPPIPRREKPKPREIPDAIEKSIANCKQHKVAEDCTTAGAFLLRGRLRETQAPQARELLKLACRGGGERGCVLLAGLLLKGIGGAKDETQGEALLSSACRLVPKLGCEPLGQMWLERRVYRKARRAFHKACKGSVLTACQMLGWFWQNGWGGRQSYYRAGALFRQACRQGLSSSCNRWGVLQAKGLFRRRGKDLRYHDLFVQACRKNVSWACFNEGMSWYQKGQDQESISKATQAFERACSLGTPAGCFSAGVLRWNQTQASSASRTQAKALWKRACNAEHQRSCSVLGYVYTKSAHEPRDCKIASGYLKQACSLGAQPCLRCPPRRRRRRAWQRIRPRWTNLGWMQKALTP